MEKECETCQRIFQLRWASDNQRFCSRECWRLSRYKWRTCQQCGKRYAGAYGGGPRRRGEKFCSRKCYDTHRERTEAERKVRQRERSRVSYLKNREKVLARSKERYKDPEFRRKKVEIAKEWALANPEKARQTRRRYWARKKYGLTLEELDVILARGCAICGTKQGSVVGPRGGFKDDPEPRLCIDHDHMNGRVRDALCHKCNAMLGQANENPMRLRAAADYLESHR